MAATSHVGETLPNSSSAMLRGDSRKMTESKITARQPDSDSSSGSDLTRGSLASESDGQSGSGIESSRRECAFSFGGQHLPQFSPRLVAIFIFLSILVEICITLAQHRTTVSPPCHARNNPNRIISRGHVSNVDRLLVPMVSNLPAAISAKWVLPEMDSCFAVEWPLDPYLGQDRLCELQTGWNDARRSFNLDLGRFLDNLLRAGAAFKSSTSSIHRCFFLDEGPSPWRTWIDCHVLVIGRERLIDPYILLLKRYLRIFDHDLTTSLNRIYTRLNQAETALFAMYDELQSVIHEVATVIDRRPWLKGDIADALLWMRQAEGDYFVASAAIHVFRKEVEALNQSLPELRENAAAILEEAFPGLHESPRTSPTWQSRWVRMITAISGKATMVDSRSPYSSLRKELDSQPWFSLSASMNHTIGAIESNYVKALAHVQSKIARGATEEWALQTYSHHFPIAPRPVPNENLEKDLPAWRALRHPNDEDGFNQHCGLVFPTPLPECLAQWAVARPNHTLGIGVGCITHPSPFLRWWYHEWGRGVVVKADTPQWPGLFDPRRKPDGHPLL